MSSLPRIVARSLPEANDDIVALGHRAAIVSVGEPGSDPPYGFKPHNPLHLRLEFHDVVETSGLPAKIVPPNADLVGELLTAARILRTAETVYVHCNAGISRSTAIAYILWCLWLGDGAEADALARVFDDRPHADPNPLLVRLADQALGRRGAMIETLEAR